MGKLSKDYIAGFLDGEGTITIGRSSYRYKTRKHNDCYIVLVGIYNTKKKVLFDIRDKYKLGHISCHINVWYLSITNKAAYKFLIDIRPHLRL